MFPFLDIINLVVKGLPIVFINPLFWLVVFLVYTQYKKSINMEKKLFGFSLNTLNELTLNAVLYGIMGGLLGSFLLIFIGVSISNIGLAYVWILAIFFMSIHPRFMCFSYSGGIVSLSSLIFGFPKVDVAALMAIVGILHFIEAILIYISGFKGATPIFLKTKEYETIGGFSMQKFWPIPLMILFIDVNPEVAEGVVKMPDWWPLIKPSPDLMETGNLIYMMLPIVAGLGYGDIATTHLPEKRSRISAKNLALFSIILLLLSIVASRIYYFQFVAALFAPLAHELLIFHGKRSEKLGVPLFAPPTKGVKILELMNNGHGKNMGLKRGDVIKYINGRLINDYEELKLVLNSYPTFVWIDGIDLNGNSFSYEYQNYRTGIKNLGIIVVPDKGEVILEIQEGYGALLKNIYRKLFRRK